MKDNLERLTDILNIELEGIRVSKELKLKTLEKCKTNKKALSKKEFLPIACTMAACLFMGVIIYPIYNKTNSVGNEKITMNTSDENVKELDRLTDNPMLRNKISTTEDSNNKILSSEILKEDSSEVKESSEKQKQEKEMIALNESPIVSYKIQSLPENDKSISTDDKSIDVGTNGDIVDKEKYMKNDNQNTSVALLEEKNNELDISEEVKMKNLSLQEARQIFQDNIKTPSYVPRDFVIEKILVPELGNSSFKLYEIIYKSNSKYFKVTEYKNTNDISGLALNSNEELNVSDEGNMIININNTPVKYILQQGDDNKELPYVKLTWERIGKKYSVEGNVPWAELINIVSSIIK